MSEQEQNPRRIVDFCAEVDQTEPARDAGKLPKKEKLDYLELINKAKLPDDSLKPKYPLEDFPEIELRPIEDEFDFGRRGFMPSFGEPARYTRWPKIGFDLEKLKLMPNVPDVAMQEGHNHETPAFDFSPEQAAAFSAWLKKYLAEHPLQMDPSIFKGLPIEREPIESDSQSDIE